MERYNLYKQLRDAGFPQGGSGMWMVEPEGNDNAIYIPTPSEIYAMYLADPAEWQLLGDSMARAWIENKKKTA